MVARGGMHGCSGGMRGCSGGGMRGCLGGAWFLWGGMRGCSRGVHGCSQGACMVARGCVVSLGGACMVAPGGHAWDMTRYADTVNEQLVRILLECILVLQASVILSMVGDGVGLASQHVSQVI